MFFVFLKKAVEPVDSSPKCKAAWKMSVRTVDCPLVLTAHAHLRGRQSRGACPGPVLFTVSSVRGLQAGAAVRSSSSFSLGSLPASPWHVPAPSCPCSAPNLSGPCACAVHPTLSARPHSSPSPQPCDQRTEKPRDLSPPLGPQLTCHSEHGCGLPRPCLLLSVARLPQHGIAHCGAGGTRRGQ